MLRSRFGLLVRSIDPSCHRGETQPCAEAEKYCERHCVPALTRHFRKQQDQHRHHAGEYPAQVVLHRPATPESPGEAKHERDDDSSDRAQEADRQQCARIECGSFRVQTEHRAEGYGQGAQYCPDQQIPTEGAFGH